LGNPKRSKPAFNRRFQRDKAKARLAGVRFLKFAFDLQQGQFAF